MNEIKLEWGISPRSKRVTVAWGARAIYQYRRAGPVIDLLWDRQIAVGPKDERDKLCYWVNLTGLELLRRKLDEGVVLASSRETVKILECPYTITASPKGSHGYLYIGAWKNPERAPRARAGVCDQCRSLGPQSRCDCNKVSV